MTNCEKIIKSVLKHQRSSNLKSAYFSHNIQYGHQSCQFLELFSKFYIRTELVCRLVAYMQNFISVALKMAKIEFPVVPLLKILPKKRK